MFAEAGSAIGGRRATTVADRLPGNGDPDPARFTPGTILAERYRVVGLLGRGGMGEVYRADDLELHQSVALKFLPELMEDNAPARSRLLREVSLARRVTHPNVCRVYDIGEVDGHPFISMEYVDGEDLRTLLLRIGRLPDDKALDLAEQFARGLAAAHQKAVLHGDLKPANMMVDGLGQARIADFGLARDLRGDSIAGGTLAYMAPELAAGLGATVASDLYSLGLVFYEMFTGQPAFMGDLAELMKLHRTTLPTPPSRLVELFDPAVERVILRCLAKDPRDRPASAHDVAEALVACRPGSSKAVATKALLVCELMDDSSRELEDDVTLELLDVHDRVARSTLEGHDGREIETSDDFQLLFDQPWGAVRYALAYHRALETQNRTPGPALAGRVGIHLVEVRDTQAGGVRVEALDRTTAVRLSSLAEAGQTLLSRGVFDVARQNAVVDQHLQWLAHGTYEIEGLATPLEIFEVGPAGLAPLRAPRESAWARRRMVQTTVAGWRPAPGLELPARPNWVVEKKLNAGGYGEVWLLNQRKTGERRVFKFCWDPESLHAFGREITLFRLLKEELGERGDINRILDWNFDEEPYFIESEYTAGGSFAEWALRRGGLGQVPLEVRLEIVAQVATALAAAHSVGVLHKDVKPGNVLIIDDPAGASEVRAKLSDFGIALVTERRRLDEAGITVLGLTESTADASAPHAGTRLYTAPELLEGKPPTLQADIYALGVMLYQAVVGDFTRALAPGWRRDVGDELLEEDIAAAVDGSADRRLSSALRLAERLRGLEIRRQQQAEQRRKLQEAEQAKATVERWRRRRRVTALVLGLSILFGGAMARLAYRVQQEAQRANREALAAHKTAAILAELFELSDPFGVADPGEARGNMTVRELLESAVRRLDEEFGDQPVIRARLVSQVGKGFRGLGLYAHAEPLLERALATQQQHLDEPHADMAWSLNELALVRQAMGDYAKAEPLFRVAIAQRRQLFGEMNAELAESLDDLGNLLAEKGDYKRAEPLLEQALEIRQKLFQGDGALVGLSLNNLAALKYRLGKYENAERLYKKALAICRRHLDKDHPSLATILNNLAGLLRSRGDYDGAAPLYREALERFRRTLGDEHRQVGMSLNNLALVYFDKRNYEDAAKLLRESEALYRRALGDEHPTLAAVLNNRARLEVALGRYAAGESLIRQALKIFRDTHAPGYWRIANAESVLGSCLAGFGRFAEAERLMVAAYPVVREQRGHQAAVTRELIDRIVALYEAWDQPEKADEYRALRSGGGILALP